MTEQRVARFDNVTLVHGSALQELPRWGYYDAVIADAPYSSGGANITARRQPVQSKYINSKSSNKALPLFSGDHMDQRSFVLFNILWMELARQNATEGAPICVFSDWRQIGATADSVQCAGWTWRGVAQWTKPTARPILGRFKSAAEYILWGSNGPMPLDRPVPALPGDFRHATPRERVHITQKPVGLMVDLFQIVPAGQVICDPFAGSATGAIAALQTGHEWIGFEIDGTTFDNAVARVRAHIEGGAS